MCNGGDRFGIHGLTKGTFSVFSTWKETFPLLLRSRDLNNRCEKRILEIGCRHGQWHREFIEWEASPDNLTGGDILPDRITYANQLPSQGVQVHYGNPVKHSFTNASFEVILQFTAFSSILDMTVKEMLAREMLRVLKEGSLIFWYNFIVKGASNPDVRGLRKREISHFQSYRNDLHRASLLLALPCLRGPYSWLRCYVLEQVRRFNAHYL